MLKARIIAHGVFLPESILTNSDLEKRVDTSDEWIFTRTGIRERRIAGESETSSFMGVEAAKRALEQADLESEKIDAIIVATMTPDYLAPSTAALIQKGLGAKKAFAFDISAACCGYSYALSIAKAYIESGMYNNILIVATEKMSSIVDWQDRTTCVLFGDGAAASVVSSSGPGYLIDGVILGCDGEYDFAFKTPAGGCVEPASLESVKNRRHFVKMEGKEVFKQAVKGMAQSAISSLEKSGLSLSQIDYVVCHQANVRILDAVAQKLGIDETRLYKTVHKYGNTSASAVVIALEELLREKKGSSLENILLLTFGAGLTWGGTVLKRVLKE